MAHYYDSMPDTPSDRRLIDYRANGINFSFVTDTNVFSRNDVDKGTDLLINSVIEDIKERGARKGERLLDLGCGYGVVGVVMKSVFMSFEVTSVDVNARAVELARENMASNNVKLTKCMQSNVLSALDESDIFDIVMTNPPVRAGKQTVFSFYEQAYEHMAPGASIYSVLQRKQGAPSSEKKLMELFGNCETVAISGGYRVMKAVKENP
ncbi:16S rRNA (guanine1207-N2)-methyltransferase [Oscillospiraceae bacterium]|nr:16S rRNA (guanine1207-N2)-methyltransferase [Oscillospiraceae bacterium]